MNGPYEIIPGVQKSVFFPLYALDGTDILTTSPTFASGDAKLKVDGGTSTNFTPQHRGDGIYTVTITAGSTTAGDENGLLVVRDLTSPQTWLSTALEVRILSLAEVASRYYDGPVGPGVYFQQTTGAAGTTLGTNGTATNPCSSIADAKSIADTLGVNLIYMLPDASATFTAAANDYHFYGTGNQSSAEVILGGQDFKNAKFEGIKVSGTSGATGDATFINCVLDSVTGLRGLAKECGLTGTSSVIASTAMTFEKCYSLVPGASTPGLTFAASASVGFRHYSGGIQFNSGAATNAVTVEGVGKLVIAATCTSLAVQVRGSWLVSDLGTTSSLTYDSNMQTALDILEDTDTTIPGELAGIEAKIDTVDTVVDRIEIDTTSIETKVDTVDTVVDAILVDTNTDIPATLTTIEGKVDTVDTVVDAILIDTGTDIPATLVSIEGKVDTVDTVVDSILVDTGTDLKAQISALNDFDPATDTVANVTTVGSVTNPVTTTVSGTVDANVIEVDGVALVAHTAGKVPADATATISGTIDANVIEIDGVALALPHGAGRMPSDSTSGIDVYAGAVYFNSSGSSGALFGTHGTPVLPSSNESDAVTLAGSTGLRRIFVTGDSLFAASGSISNMHFEGVGGEGAFSANAQNVLGCSFRNLKITGSFNAVAAENWFDGCEMQTPTFNSDVYLDNCLIAGGTTINSGDTLYLRHCAAKGSSARFQLPGASASLINLGWSGDLTLASMTNSSEVLIEGVGFVTIDVSCTGGRVTLRGDVSYIDNSGGLVSVNVDTGVNLTSIAGDSGLADKLADYMGVTERTTVSGSATTQSFSAAGLTSAYDNVYVDRIGRFVTGTLAGHGFLVRGFDGGTKTLTTTELIAVPQVGDRFILES